MDRLDRTGRATPGGCSEETRGPRVRHFAATDAPHGARTRDGTSAGTRGGACRGIPRDGPACGSRAQEPADANSVRYRASEARCARFTARASGGTRGRVNAPGADGAQLLAVWTDAGGTSGRRRHGGAGEVHGALDGGGTSSATAGSR